LDLAIGGAPTSSADGEVITLIFNRPVDENAYGFEAPGKNYSFILYPSAFNGPGIGKLSTSLTALNFRVEMPTMTNYAKYQIEKATYDKVEVLWKNVDPYNIEEDIEGMLISNALLNKATGEFYNYLKPLSAENFPGEETGSFSTGSWLSPPDLSKGHWFGNTTVQLGPINADPGYDSNSAPIQISVLLNFSSNVGDAIIAIKDAEAAGSFSAKANVTDSASFWNIIAIVAPKNVDITERSPIPSRFGPGAHNVDLDIDDKDGDSPSDTVSIRVIR
jgi:hypothetical protein